MYNASNCRKMKCRRNLARFGAVFTKIYWEQMCRSSSYRWSPPRRPTASAAHYSHTLQFCQVFRAARSQHGIRTAGRAALQPCHYRHCAPHYRFCAATASISLQPHYRNLGNYSYTTYTLQHGACTTARHLATAWTECAVHMHDHAYELNMHKKTLDTGCFTTGCEEVAK